MLDDQCFEFLDHTADVQIHSWGENLQEAFENAAIAMSAYITDINLIEIQDKKEVTVEAEDLQGLLYRFLDEFLYLFNAEPYFISKRVRILEFDRRNFTIRAEGYGECFSLDKHTQGTEIKAITYSNMQIFDDDNRHEIYCIVDI